MASWDGQRHTGIYRIAGHTVQFTTHSKLLHELSKDYCCDEAPDLFIEISSDDIVNEHKTAMEEDLLEGVAPKRYPFEYLEATAVYRKLTHFLIDYDLILMHGSAIAVDEDGYLFTAKSGTGKSTHTRLWREYFGERAVMVNDDKPLLGVKGNQVIVYGTPWNGKHNLGANISVPLKAMCILERGIKNEIKQLAAEEAFPMLLQQSNRALDSKKMLKTLELLEQLIKLVPIYLLRCNMELDAARVAYEGMQQT